jgi:O-antigen/teichoic acid export membrane protein
MPSGPDSKSAVTGAAVNWLAFAATLAVAFALTPHLVRTFGPARYDVWCVAEAVLAYFTLLDLGIAPCLVRLVARHHARHDPQELNRTASTCLAVYLAAGAVALLVGVPVLLSLAPGLGTKAGGANDVTAFLLVMLANLAATLPLSVFPNLLDGLERFTAKGSVRIVFLALRTTGVLAVTWTGNSLLPVAIVSAASNLLEHAVLAALCFRFLPGLRFARRLVDRATIRTVIGSSTDAFLAMIAGRVTVQTGAIVVGLFLPAGQVTVFATGARLVEYTKTLLRTITATLTPGVAAMEARGDVDGIRRLYLTATRWVLYLAVPVNLGLWFFGRPFLARWVPEVGTAGFVPLAVLAGTVTLGVGQSVASRVLYGLGRLRLFARLALAEAALNLILTLCLVRSWGVEGVAWAVAGPNVLFCLAVIGYTVRVLGVSVRSYVTAWAPPFAAAVAPTLIWAGAPASATWGGIASGLLTGLVPWAVIVFGIEWRLIRPRPERRPILHSGRIGRVYDAVVAKTGRLHRQGGSPEGRRP